MSSCLNKHCSTTIPFTWQLLQRILLMDMKLSLKHVHVALRFIKLIFTFLILGRRDHNYNNYSFHMYGFLLMHPNYIKSIFKRPLERLQKISLKKYAKFSHMQKVLPDFTETTIKYRVSSGKTQLIST